MPIYMDRHDVSEQVTAEIVAQLHQQDLKIQDRYQCKGITYWFDDQRKTAFCLVEAPNKEAIIAMHRDAHGEVPHQVIEVDGQIVESFLGRIEDPKKSQKTVLNIINDPAFRIIMVLSITKGTLKNGPSHELDLFLDTAVAMVLRSFGRIVRQQKGRFLISFDSVTKALECAMQLRKADRSPDIHITMGISAGVPVTEKSAIFEDTIKMSERLCDIVKETVAITQEVRELYECENRNIAPNSALVRTLDSSECRFLNVLMDLMEKEWNNTSFTVEDFGRELGYSNSQLYRKMIALTQRSLNTFVLEQRLERALVLLQKKNATLAEIAFETGFNSPAYFSKCFHKRFGTLPSTYVKRL